jgi:hypothetical protein
MVINYKMDNTLLVGPYIGDFKNEILSFRPHAKWMFNQLNQPNCFIASHSNRRFLYDWIPDENFIPVFEHLTRDESGQNAYLHSKIKIPDYKILVKNFKKSVSEITDIRKGSSLYHICHYSERLPVYPIYKKSFSKIDVEPIVNGKIIYIADPLINNNQEIFKRLSENFDNVVLFGDKNCENIFECLNFSIDYAENGFINTVRNILGCKMVITHCNHWVLTCNIHGVPIFNWNKEDGNTYKKDGTFGFNNSKSFILIDDNVDKIVSGVKYFYKKLY